MTRVPGRSYVVGGAVRDRLLGLPVSDRDHVVVGATVDAMRAAGFTPVGRDFPVFLHPETHEEYALARTERKVAAGYGGFVFHADPSVTLEDDLARRDLTVNAMAEDDRTGALIDPLGGRHDLEARVFRHVGPAFVEDPVRVLRLARFAARFPDFTVAPETMTLARAMASAGEIDALVAERVWQELSRGLMERHPVRLFDVLREAHALGRLLPEVDAIGDAGWQETVDALERAVADAAPIEVRFAVALHGVPADAIDPLCQRLAVPRAVRDVAVLAAAEGPGLQAMLAEPAADGAAAGLVAALERGDAFRRRPRFGHVVASVAACIPDAADRARFAQRIVRVLDAVDAVDAAAIARATEQPAQIPIRLRAARGAAIDELWKDVAPPAGTDGR